MAELSDNVPISEITNYISQKVDEKLEWYSTIKEEFEKYGIPVDDISKVVVIANNVAKLFGYDNQKIIDALSNL